MLTGDGVLINPLHILLLDTLDMFLISFLKWQWQATATQENEIIKVQTR
jgi:hypothetical protein